MQNPNPNDKSMTKRDLVVRISEETGLVQQDVLNVVQKTLDYIGEAVAQGTKVELRNLGVFEATVRKRAWGATPTLPLPTAGSRPEPWSSSNPAKKCAKPCSG